MYHHQKLKSEHRNRYSINFKAGISICPSDSEMRLSKRTALPEKRRKRAEEEEGQKVNGEGKTVGNFNLPRVTKRLATPRIATACWIRNRTFPRERKKKRKDRGYRSEVWLYARMSRWYRFIASVAPWVETSLHRFRCRSGALPGFLLDFFPSLTPSTFRPSSLSTAPTPFHQSSRAPLSRDRLSIREEKECFLRRFGGRGGEELNFAAWISRYEENDDLRVQNPFTTITIAVGNRHARTKGNSNKSETRSRPSFERTMDGWLMHAVPTWTVLLFFFFPHHLEKFVPAQLRISLALQFQTIPRLPEIISCTVEFNKKMEKKIVPPLSLSEKHHRFE